MLGTNLNLKALEKILLLTGQLQKTKPTWILENGLSQPLSETFSFQHLSIHVEMKSPTAEIQCLLDVRASLRRLCNFTYLLPAYTECCRKSHKPDVAPNMLCLKFMSNSWAAKTSHKFYNESIKLTRFMCFKKTLQLYTPFFMSPVCFWFFWSVPGRKGTPPNTEQSHCTRCPKCPAVDSGIRPPQDPALVRLCGRKRQERPKVWLKATLHARASVVAIVVSLTAPAGTVGVQGLE